MGWTQSSPERMAKAKGIADARAERAMRVNDAWPPALRREYRDAYTKTAQEMKKNG